MEKPRQLLIVSITPYFLEKEAVWFEKNLEEIIKSAKTQPFFQENTLFVQEGQTHQVTDLIKKLDDMGYERVLKADSPGEFSKQGGTIDIFPINTLQAERLDFLGNTIERISPLEHTISDEKKSKQVLQKKLQNQKLFSGLKNPLPGDYLVHLDHGVGRFFGMETIASQEYYVLAYAKEDKLYVPVGLERKLSKYVGFTDPAVARLGSALWQNTKRKVKEEVEKLAQELLALYAKKETVTRTAYDKDHPLELQIAAGFLHEETPDQRQAIEDIAKDLQQEKPMDRIVCADVGFGKTEIALRSACMAVANSYQAAIICPTTILANQHFATFKHRFEKLPIRVALLSRLQSPSEQAAIIKDIARGVIDIIIGTHRILSCDVVFKNLQLLIIDDEQRFGVKQKERLRQKQPALDILSLSATPIPRTIYLALSSFKNISLVHTPPKGRMAIKTTVAPYNSKTVKKAIESELARGGQVYFLHNRVSSIEKTKQRLQRLVAQAKIGTIHGRMTERELIEAMEDFQNKKTTILIATTIIENGIDLPNVNTIIIEDASRLGLSQAYQIRGRVGRSHVQGHAYLFHPQNLTPLAKERLAALNENTELGAGYRIAIKDLELRGAGNILGKEQSGSINKIGLNLYCQMLAEAVEKTRE